VSQGRWNKEAKLQDNLSLPSDFNLRPGSSKIKAKTKQQQELNGKKKNNKNPNLK
jgi:hypothetical protein